jgi:hypothetical protein
VVGIQTVEFDVESLRFRPRSMDNAELLRFGQAANLQVVRRLHVLDLLGYRRRPQLVATTLRRIAKAKS